MDPLNYLCVSVNSAEFLSKEESQVPVDEIFFHRCVPAKSPDIFPLFFDCILFNEFCFFVSFVSFFKKRQQEKQQRRPRGDDDDESLEDVDDDEFEKLLGK